MNPSMAPDQSEICPICGRNSTVIPEFNDAHLVKRSHGGTETVRICLACHNEEHKLGWAITHSENFLYVKDRDGDIIVQRPIAWPEGWDQGLFIARLQQAPRDLALLSSQFIWLDDDGLVAAGEALYQLHDAAWHCRARLFQTAALRSPWGDRGERLKDLVRQLDVSPRTAYREMQALEVWEAAGLSVSTVAQLPSPTVILAAAATGDLAAAMTLYVDRKAAGRYSDSQFREELRRGVTDSIQAPPEWCTCTCEHCGATEIRHPRREE